jgi:hypothetical protein
MKATAARQVGHAHDQPVLNRSRLKHGSVIVTTMIALMFVMVMGAGILSLTMHGLHLAKRVKRSTVAFNLAESGIERAIRWLKDQASPPAGTANIDPFGGSQSMGGGTYTVVIKPDAGNAGATLKKYVLTATAVYASHTEKLEVVMRQSSFGKFAYFTDRETSSISGGRIWFFAGDRIRGPAHSNNDLGSDFQVSWGGANPIFEDVVTSAGSLINYAPDAPDTEAEFAQIFKAGSRGYQLGVDNIPMPTSSDVQKVAAWGSGSGFPSTNGVYTPPGGGVYIRGDSSVDMTVDASGNQQFKVTQSGVVTTVTIDTINNRRITQVGSGTPTYTTGAGSGVLYSTGHIWDLSGTIADNRTAGTPAAVTTRSAYTLATDVNAGKSITVDGPLKHKTPSNPALPMTDPANIKAGTLGLIGRNVMVEAGAPSAMEIDAVIMAGSSSTADGSFFVQDYSSKTPTGSLKVLGGIIQKARGPVGTLSGGALATGYSKDYYYDGRMADNPPPFFPTTGGYDRLSWRRTN